jgi:hypothetical protein
MAQIIRLSDFGRFSEQQVNKLIRVVVLETDLMLKMQSPVDTGRFRMSWVVGENTTGSYDAGPQSKSTGAFIGQTSPPKNPIPGLAVGINYRPDTERVGNSYHIHNTLPYAERLGNGHSTQAPAGWVELIARQMANRARQLADQIGRQS